MEKSELLQLPVFQLTGGTEQDRRRFAEQLIEELESRSYRTALAEPGNLDISQGLSTLLQSYDLVLASEDLALPVQQIVFDKTEAVSALGPSPRSCSKEMVEKCCSELVQRHNLLVKKRPVWACILIGGKSSRMGRPKHLIRDENGKTWLENSIDLLLPFVDGVVISGKGDVPGSICDFKRLSDAPEVVGPLAGILSAYRWRPLVSWLLLACDMPLITKEAVSWVLEQRRAADWGVVPVLGGLGRYEPLFAYYDYRSASLFEQQVKSGNLRISKVGAEDKIFNPVVPVQLRRCWENVNRPEQLKGTLTKSP